MKWKTVSWICPQCGWFGPMPILDWARVHKRTCWTVECHKCGAVFTFTRSPNLWHQLRFKYKVPKEQIRMMQKGMMGEVTEGKKPTIIRGQDILIVNQYLFTPGGDAKE